MVDGDLVAARHQTAGRGRHTRRWISQDGSNLCFSRFTATAVPLAEIPSLTMAAALAVTDLLNTHGIAAAPKWPNDVLVNGDKICGILSERVERASSPTAGIIVGIGLNINMDAAEANAIGRPATSMQIETGCCYEPETILAELLPRLTTWIECWRQGGFSALRAIWTERAGPIGKPLCVHDGELILNGTLAGFGEYGELLLQTNTGIKPIWSGDVS